MEIYLKFLNYLKILNKVIIHKLKFNIKFIFLMFKLLTHLLMDISNQYFFKVFIINYNELILNKNLLLFQSFFHFSYIK